MNDIGHLSAMGEIWRPIPRYPKYQVSNLGRVKRRHGKVLKPRLHTNGYLRVYLGAKNEEYIHRIVCMAFYGPPPNSEYHADHKDKNRQNNQVENLEWKSPADNRATRVFKRGAQHHLSKLSEDQVRLILRAGKDYKPGGDKIFAKRFGVSREQVRDIRLRKNWKHVDV